MKLGGLDSEILNLGERLRKRGVKAMKLIVGENLGNKPVKDCFEKVGSYESRDGLKTFDTVTGRLLSVDKIKGNKFISTVYGLDGSVTTKVSKLGFALKDSPQFKLDKALKDALFSAMDSPQFKLDKNLVKKLIDEQSEFIKKLASYKDSKGEQLFSPEEIVGFLGNVPEIVTKRADDVFKVLEDPNNRKFIEKASCRSFCLYREIVG